MESNAPVQHDNRIPSSTRILIAFVFTLGALLGNPRGAFGVLRVVTTTEDLASISRSVGGDLVNVSAIAKGTQDPHYIEAKPSFFVLASRADLVISIGLSLESGWLPLVLRGARQPSILPGAKGNLEASDAITPIEVRSDADRSQGDVHPLGNPHFMADPERVLLVAARIAKKFSELDPTNAAQYQKGLEQFSSGLSEKIKGWKARLHPFAKAKVIGYHQTFNYLFRFFDLEPVGYIEPKPGIPPTAKHILELVQTAKEKKARLIVVENFFDPKPAQTLASQSGAHYVLIPAYVGGDDNSKTYEQWMEGMVSAIEKGFK